MAREVLLRRATEAGILTGAAIVVWAARFARSTQDQPIDPLTGLVSPNGHKERRLRGSAAFEAQLRNFAQTGRGR